MRLVLLLFILLSSTLVFADENSSTAPAPVPNPQALEGGWWQYFNADEITNKTGLDERIEKSHSYTQNLFKDFPVEQNNNLTPLLNTLYDALDHYSALRFNTSDANSITLEPLHDQYTISQAFERFLQTRKLEQTLDVDSDDLAWQDAQIKIDRQRQSQQRGEYLKMNALDPQRSLKGLGLMISRVNIEIASLQAKFKFNQIKQTRQLIQAEKSGLENIHKRLIHTPDVTSQWNDQRAIEEEQVAQLDSEMLPTFAIQSPGNEIGSINIKHLLLLESEKELQLALHKLKSLRLQAMVIFNDWLTNKKGNESLNKVFDNLLAYSDEIVTQKHTWEALTEQGRKFATAKIEASDDKERPVVAAYTELFKQINKNERQLRELSTELDVNNFLSRLISSSLTKHAGWLTLSTFWLDLKWEKIGDWFNASLFEINETPVTTAGILRVLIIVIFAWILSNVIQRGLKKVGAGNQTINASTLYALSRVIHYIVLFVGIIIALSSVGIDFTKFALFASALGIGIGFSLQTIISNLVAGLIILFERSLKVGDFIEISSGLAGEVKEINMRSTLITTNDNIDILVPNADFVSNHVTNWTLRDTFRRIHVPFGVAYGTDKDLVKKAVLEAADAVKWTLKGDETRKPDIWLVGFGDSSLDFELVVWLAPEAVNRPGTVQASYLWEIETKLAKYGIEIPFPQRDLHVRTVFGE